MIMQPRGNRQWKCYACRKNCYRSRAEANVDVTTRMANGASPLYVYECPNGYGYHLTRRKPVCDNNAST